MQQPIQAMPLPACARHLAIDRFEGDIAVLALADAAGTTGETFADVPRSALPSNSKEGDWLVQHLDGSYQINAPLTAQRRAEAKARLEALLHQTK